MTILLGQAAPPGSTIGIVTPGSLPESRAEVQRGIAWWKAHGYNAKLMPGALGAADWHAGSPEIRARDIQEAFAEWHEWTSSPRSKTLEEVLTGRLAHLGVPILDGLPLGHGATLSTLPLGVQATVDADALTLTIDEPARLGA
jgi:Uncharacterized proteins, homologs of microcin C7 resistance protein MccF